MKNMTVEAIITVTGGVYQGPEEFKNMEIEGVATDSRKAGKGFLFIPLKGERADGHDFIPDVLKKGALLSLSERKLPDVSGYVRVTSCAQALKDLAEYYREQLGCRIVGITGSVGKTSTKEMIASVLSQRYKVQKTAGNLNNEIGLPLTIFSIREEHDVAVVEMGISDFGEMSRLAKIAKPDICLITNIGYSHLKRLGDRDGILKAKTECLEYLQEGGAVILNGDDDKLAALETANGTEPCFYGIGEKGNRLAEAVSVENLGLQGMAVTIKLRGEKFDVTIPLPGEHNVYNALAAACVGAVLGLTTEEIRLGIAGVQTIQGRNRMLSVGGMQVIDDCYNANPVSMKASIDVLAKCDGRKIAVLGDMGELGTEEKELHYQVGKHVAEKEIDALYCAGVLAKQMAEGACETGHTQVLYYGNKEDMIGNLLSFIKKGDTILVKASHFMQFEEIIHRILEK